MPAARILLVEDDRPLAAMIVEYLRPHGFEVVVEGRGDRAHTRVLAEQPDLVVLDLTLPGRDGLEICRTLRPHWRGPILMLTARGDVTDEVVGLELGADDYLAKPVKPRVLLARVRALLRRPAAQVPDAPSDLLVVGELALDAGTRQVTLGSVMLDLTSGEFDVLWLLASSAGQVVSRHVMYEQLMGAGYDRLDRSMDLRISRVRQKLAESGATRDLIRSIRGVGYLYAKA